VNDTIVIRYQIELVVSSGGALSRSASKPPLPQIHVPAPSLGLDLASLLQSGMGADVAFEVEGESMAAHKIILQARSPVFRALLTGPMREGQEGSVDVQDVRAPVFRALLYFAYTDSLPEELQVGGRGVVWVGVGGGGVGGGTCSSQPPLWPAGGVFVDVVERGGNHECFSGLMEATSSGHPLRVPQSPKHHMCPPVTPPTPPPPPGRAPSWR
jgi:speckle-type POZ protein